MSTCANALFSHEDMKGQMQFKKTTKTEQNIPVSYWFRVFCQRLGHTSDKTSQVSASSCSFQGKISPPLNLGLQQIGADACDANRCGWHAQAVTVSCVLVFVQRYTSAYTVYHLSILHRSHFPIFYLVVCFSHWDPPNLINSSTLNPSSAINSRRFLYITGGKVVIYNSQQQHNDCWRSPGGDGSQVRGVKWSFKTKTIKAKLFYETWSEGLRLTFI